LKQRFGRDRIGVRRHRDRYRLQQDELQLRYAYDQIIGKSAALRQVLKTLDRVTDSDVTVLIQGESGTGKELYRPSPPL
jgi:transcriptional regulator with PAS, ATPase and Fis domain